MLEMKLLKDEKQCAEHIMLVDLGRNDVGKVCLYFKLYVTLLRQISCWNQVENFELCAIYLPLFLNNI